MSEGVKDTPKPPPLGVAITRNLIEAGVPGRCRDAYIVGTVIGDKQDQVGRLVGFWMSQLAKRCGMSDRNPRRLQKAIKFLTENGHLKATIPAHGTRKQSTFEMKLVPVPDNTLQNVGCEPSDTLQNGESHPTDWRVTPYKTDSDTLQNGGISSPVLPSPVISTPVSSIPISSPSGDGFSLSNDSEKGLSKKGKAGQRPFNGETIEEIYQAYPKKEAKPKAVAAIIKALAKGKIQPGDLLAAVKEYAVAIHWKDKQFIPAPASWFNAERWTDDRTNWQQPTASHSSAGRPLLSGLPGQTHSPTAKPSNSTAQFL